jgi:hypothetical protein
MEIARRDYRCTGELLSQRGERLKALRGPGGDFTDVILPPDQRLDITRS